MKARYWLWLRRISQGIFLILFLWFLLENVERPEYEPFHEEIESSVEIPTGPVRFFFLINPLLALSVVLGGNLPGRGFFWALLVVVIALLFGRFFCGFVCPLGTVNHVVSHGVRSAGNTLRYRYVKYAILSVLVVSCLGGLNIAGIFDPISLIYRFFALLLIPGLALSLQKLSGYLSSSDASLLYRASSIVETWVLELSGWKLKFYQLSWLTGSLFILVIFLNRIYPRFWCRILCPLGALFGLLARFSPLEMTRQEEQCTHCQICTKQCQSDANPEPGDEWRKSECILCLRCMAGCPEKVISFSFKKAGRKDRQNGVTRRTLLTGAVMGLSLPIMARIEGRGFEIARDKLIRPPGSLPETEFLARCYRCGICMKRCPTNVIQPAVNEAGIAGLWTPVLVMAFGYCEHTCTLCGLVCPTGAIRPLTVEEKTGKPVRIGSAYIDRGICLPWSQNIPCIVCEEHCPTSPKAIHLEIKTITRQDGSVVELQLPHVDLSRCTGCGICEYKCPVKSKPAIRVTSSGESRSGVPLLLR